MQGVRRKGLGLGGVATQDVVGREGSLALALALKISVPPSLPLLSLPPSSFPYLLALALALALTLVFVLPSRSRSLASARALARNSALSRELSREFRNSPGSSTPCGACFAVTVDIYVVFTRLFHHSHPLDGQGMENGFDMPVGRALTSW